MGIMTQKELEKNLKDWRWRLNHLYQITDEQGKQIVFQENMAQRHVVDNLHWLNLLLKSRQHGMCLDPETPVLAADLQWKPIKDFAPGDKIISVDEHPPGGRGKARKMRVGTVEAACEVERNHTESRFLIAAR